MKNYLVALFCLINYSTISAQSVSGIVINETDKRTIEFVNIGIAGKDIGTVSGLNGEFQLSLDTQYDNDSLLFSSIGFYPYAIRIGDLKKNQGQTICLKQRTYDLSEIVIKPKKYKEKVLGVTTKSKKIAAGFKNNLLGYECGVLMRVKKTALIKRVNINILSCSYDSVFYRLNIYKVKGEQDFENILREPIYISASKEMLTKELSIDLLSRDIVVEGDFLVTLEHIKDMGEGSLFFCAALMRKTYCRKTSQGRWENMPVGVSISVVADIEK